MYKASSQLVVADSTKSCKTKSDQFGFFQKKILSITNISETAIVARQLELSELEIQHQSDMEYFELLQCAEKHNTKSLAILREEGRNSLPALEEEIRSLASDNEDYELLNSTITYWKKADFDAGEQLIDEDLTEEEIKLLGFSKNKMLPR